MLFLLRHGQIQGYETKRFIGQTDVLLDDIGRAQALFWKRVYEESGIFFDAVYSSSLKRCMETANIICSNKSISKEIVIDHRLNEINMGSWDGKSFYEIKKNMPLEFEQRGRQIEHFRAPGGESFDDLLKRANHFFKDLTAKEMIKKKRRILVITHSGVMRVLLHSIVENRHNKPTQLFERKIDYSQLFIIHN